MFLSLEVFASVSGSQNASLPSAFPQTCLPKLMCTHSGLFLFFFFKVIISCLCNYAQTESHATCPVLPPFPNKNTVSKNIKGRQTLKVDTEERKLKIKTQQQNIPFGCFGHTEMTCVVIYVLQMIKTTRSNLSVPYHQLLLYKNKLFWMQHKFTTSYMGPVRDPTVPPGLPCHIGQQK